MALWEYGELLAEAVSVSDEGDWVTKTALTWHGPSGDARSLSGGALPSLNRLGANDWELVAVTRNQIEERFQVKAITTYVLRRPLRRRTRRGDPYDALPVA
jgi:hypothetical protein